MCVGVCKRGVFVQAITPTSIVVLDMYTSEIYAFECTHIPFKRFATNTVECRCQPFRRTLSNIIFVLAGKKGGKGLSLNALRDGQPITMVTVTSKSKKISDEVDKGPVVLQKIHMITNPERDSTGLLQ